MMAYKGFHSDLSCTMGRGRYQYEVGKTYKEENAQCASTGYHCVEEPIEVLKWYSGKRDRYCMVDAGGDVHEDGKDKISCTEITILREITLQQLAALECKWMQEHPERKYSGKVKKEHGTAEGGIAIVRGKRPKAAGNLGDTLFLVKESPKSRDIIRIGAFEIDGENFLPDVNYDVEGRRCR